MGGNALFRPSVVGALGALAGLLVGGSTVKAYDWRTEWYIPAPMSVVYEAMTSREAVREWWPSMELVDEAGGDDLRVGSRVSFKVHQAPEVARLGPPFRIYCVYTDVEPGRRLREVVTGDLAGVLETLFEEEAGGTRVTFNWYVRLTNPVLNVLGYAIEGVYRRSHDGVMNAGESELGAFCSQERQRETRN